jgi:hypothetical protein
MPIARSDADGNRTRVDELEGLAANANIAPAPGDQLPTEPVVALRTERSATPLSAVSGPPALDYRIGSVGMVGFEPTVSCTRDTWVCHYPTSRKKRNPVSCDTGSCCKSRNFGGAECHKRQWRRG